MTVLSPPSAIIRPANYLDPLDWSKVFGRVAPVEIDVGCGKGGFLVWAARQRPAHNFLGVDRLLVRLRKADKKAARAGVTNVRLLRIESSYLIGRLIPADSVTAYHIFFPDPWPKRRHIARRLFNAAFLRDVDRTLQRGGAVHVATDDANYFAQIQEVARESGRFGEVTPVALPVEAQTEFEQLFVAQGLPIFRACYRRRD
jgi:tRNA (guanine-N7-)-methyltransferase